MTGRVIERDVTCPHCWENHTVLIDTTDEARQFIEDCQVCCHPMQINFRVDDDELTSLSVDAA